jgi:hypothetical protein
MDNQELDDSNRLTGCTKVPIDGSLKVSGVQVFLVLVARQCLEDGLCNVNVGAIKGCKERGGEVRTE